MTAEQVAAIEQSVNEKIRDRLPVNVRELSLDDPEVEQVRGEPVWCLQQSAHPRAPHQNSDSPPPFLTFQVRGRGLPDDHAGPIRVVTIKSVDSNMCCGTHVSNLSDLQVGERGLLNGWERASGVGNHSRAGSDGGDTRGVLSEVTPLLLLSCLGKSWSLLPSGPAPAVAYPCIRVYVTFLPHVGH